MQNICVCVCFGRATAVLPAVASTVTQSSVSRSWPCPCTSQQEKALFSPQQQEDHVLHLYEQLVINLAYRTYTQTHTHTQATQTQTCSPLGPHRIPALQKIEPNSEIATLLAVVGPGSHVTTAGLRWIQQIAKDCEKQKKGKKVTCRIYAAGVSSLRHVKVCVCVCLYPGAQTELPLDQLCEQLRDLLLKTQNSGTIR